MIKYRVEKRKNNEDELGKYIVYRYSFTKHGSSVKGLYKGNYKDCVLFKNKLNEKIS